MTIQSFKELHVWQKAFRLVVSIYRLTDAFPSQERYGLASQMRRAVVSIPSNIAEGRQRKTRKDFLQFLHIADGSSAELETQILLSKELFPQLDINDPLQTLNEIQRMLGAMIIKLDSEKL